MTNYYLALFNSTTWEEFLDAGGNIYGTTKNKENRAKKLKSGDKLICYISKIGTFSGILELKSESYIDNTPVWKDADYPVRFNVRTIISIDPLNGVQVRSLFNNLTIFSRLKNPQA
jgi:predicted RNA-binding protein